MTLFLEKLYELDINVSIIWVIYAAVLMLPPNNWVG